ncbi:MAG: hypothetical protein WCJ35_06655 [Planctomycetota bacterium]
MDNENVLVRLGVQAVEQFFLFGVVSPHGVEVKTAERLVQRMRDVRHPGHPLVAVKPHGNR